ncbi:hypothetical protein Mucpa_3102 [Mucilaginibacter paludis DSM 18603]|uniref:Uncharacterized protein n=1 Tax=Mucilaginibacter paludis DSM 18603 TaxID=714943 RepID=H1YEH2_9SPHI|nr:hypothetical protein Mucpa_3102 [Mucilaginibacter paludis DSM 18603]
MIQVFNWKYFQTNKCVKQKSPHPEIRSGDFCFEMQEIR